MKTFKRIYYSVMAALMLLLLVLSLVDANIGSYKNRFDSDMLNNVKEHVSQLSISERSSYNATFLEDSKEYIEKELALYATPVTATLDEEDGMDDVAAATTNGLPKATVVTQSATVSQDTQKLIADFGKNHIDVNKTVNNIAVYIPGTVTKDIKTANNAAATTADVLMMTVNYDSVSYGAAGNAMPVAAMMENIRHISKNKLTFKNDLLFVFTDAKEEGSLGAYTFLNQFKGFDNAVSRIKLGSNFDAFGNKGTLMLYRTTNNNAKIVSSYTKINKGAFVSSFVEYLNRGMKNYSDFEAYGDIPALSFANIGGGSTYNTVADKASEVSDSLIKQTADMMFKVYNYYGDNNLAGLDKEGTAVFFSYLDIATIWYPTFVSFIFGGIIAGLIAAIIILNKKKKAFSWSKAALGAGVQLLSVAATVGIMFLVYFLTMLIVSGFGIIPLRIISSIKYMNTGILVSSLFASGIILTALYVILKKALNAKAADVVRGNALLWAFIALVMSFAFPQAAYLFIFTAILELTVMLLYVMFKDKYKEKYKQDMERLFLYAWPVILTAPIIIGFIAVAAMSLNAVLLPIILSLFLLMAGSVLPYANYLKPLMDKVFTKLPMGTTKRYETVTEKVEDKAKKGKFTEVTSTKVIKEKTARKYSNKIGLAVSFATVFVLMIIFSCFSSGYALNLTGSKSYDDYVYDASLVYVWEQNSGGTPQTSIEIKDQLAYQYFSRYISGYTWDSEKNAYVKEYYNSQLLGSTERMPSFTKAGGKYEVNVFDTERSKVYLNFSGTSGVTKFTVTQSSSGDSFEYTNDGHDTFSFRMPKGFGNFEITAEGTTVGMSVKYEEKVVQNQTSNQIADYIILDEEFAGDDFADLNSGFIFRINKVVD